jgi:hypothetical protein
MRFALILSAGLAVVSVPAGAAVKVDASQHAIAVAASCPKMEGYPDCHPDAESTWSTHSGRVFRTRA